MFERSKRRPMSEINIVPYVDVMLVLLVIFMVTAPMLTQGVQVDLPVTAHQSQELKQTDKPPLIISVDSEGNLYLNDTDEPDRSLAPKYVQAKIQAALKHDPHRAVYIKGDRSASYELVMRAMIISKQAGAQKVGLLTQTANLSP